MPGATSRGYEYPSPSDPIGDGAATVQALAETIDAQLKRQESGLATSASLAAGTSGDLSITFGAAFAAAPIVLATVRQNSNAPESWQVIVKTVSTTGAVLRVRNGTGAAATVPVNWLAIG